MSPALQVDSLPAEPQGKPKNTGVGSLSLPQEIFLTQESNRGLLHCRQILYQLSFNSLMVQWLRLCLYCRGQGFDSLSGNKNPTCHRVWPRRRGVGGRQVLFRKISKITHALPLLHPFFPPPLPPPLFLFFFSLSVSLFLCACLRVFVWLPHIPGVHDR